MKYQEQGHKGTKGQRHKGAKGLCASVPVCLCAFGFLFLAGCRNSPKADVSAAQLEQLRQENAALQQQLEQSQAEKEQFREQVQVLSGLPEEVRLESIRPLVGIKVGRFSGFYDKDKDGRREKLIVYIEPMDKQGDRIKAPGTVEVQLWDLNTTADGALLGQWHVDSQQLAQSWFDTLLSTNYRCMFDIAGKADDLSKPLTVKVTFTDMLTGRTFTDQRAIKPKQS